MFASLDVLTDGRMICGVGDRYTGGIGLGLTIARRLVEAHGGDISVASEEGHGAEFRVVFPLNWTGSVDQDSDLQ
jgi:signal transduction histidine kinase